MTTEDMLKKWAEDKYGLSGVTSVDFDIQGSYDDGCDTCGYGSTPPSIEVTVRHAGGYSYFEESYAPDLINSILASVVK